MSDESDEVYDDRHGVFSMSAVTFLAVAGAVLGASLGALTDGNDGLQVGLLVAGVAVALVLAAVVWRQHHVAH